MGLNFVWLGLVNAESESHRVSDAETDCHDQDESLSLSQMVEIVSGVSIAGYL
jgi:hypothetical protein